MMPIMDGFQVCKVLKSDPTTTYIPVVMITALHDTYDKVQGINSGADDFLSKPINDIALFARIRSLVRLKMLIDELRLRGQTNSEISGVIENQIMDYSNQISDASILIIDQDITQSEEICIVLKECFKNVVVSHNISHALKIGIENNYDLIIINVHLAGEEGLKLCSQFRSNVNTRYTPILILLDEQDDNYNLIKALDMGVNDYLVVPLDKNELKARANLQVKRKRYQDALRANLYHNMKMAIKDPLTNCYNRYYFDMHLKNIMKEYSIKGKGLSLMMIDVDHFKKVNDSFGHHAGDECLKQIQRRIGENIRAVDLLARFGGEEFVVLLPDTKINEAQIIAERIRFIIAEKPFDFLDSCKINQTISIGVAQMSYGDSTNQLIENADKCLYKAKNSGRNKVVVQSN